MGSFQSENFSKQPPSYHELQFLLRKNEEQFKRWLDYVANAENELTALLRSKGLWNQVRPAHIHEATLLLGKEK